MGKIITCAVKALGEEDPLADEALVGSCKLEFGDREGVAQVQDAIHVWVGEVPEKLPFREGLSTLGSVSFENFLFRPFLLCLALDRKQVIPMAEAFCSLLKQLVEVNTTGRSENYDNHSETVRRCTSVLHWHMPGGNDKDASG